MPLKSVTWNDIITHCINFSKPHKSIDNVYCWKIFSTPDNENVPFEREAFFQYLTFECGDFEVINNHVELLLTNLELWTKSRLHYWQRMYDILCAEYEPLWNYNRYDEEKHTKDNTLIDDFNGKVAGYDSGFLVDSNAGHDDASENEQFERTNHSYGNIGVMSSQDLVKQELEIAQISMYQIIIDEFKQYFCLAIY